MSGSCLESEGEWWCAMPGIQQVLCSANPLCFSSPSPFLHRACWVQMSRCPTMWYTGTWGTCSSLPEGFSEPVLPLANNTPVGCIPKLWLGLADPAQGSVLTFSDGILVRFRGTQRLRNTGHGRLALPCCHIPPQNTRVSTSTRRDEELQAF